MYMGLITQVCTDFDVCIKLTVFEQYRPPDYENDLGFALSRLSFFTSRFFLKLECSPRMNKLFRYCNIKQQDIRNLLIIICFICDWNSRARDKH
jgi:hypothetical protein